MPPGSTPLSADRLTDVRSKRSVKDSPIPLNGQGISFNDYAAAGLADNGAKVAD